MISPMPSRCPVVEPSSRIRTVAAPSRTTSPPSGPTMDSLIMTSPRIGSELFVRADSHDDSLPSNKMQVHSHEENEPSRRGSDDDAERPRRAREPEGADPRGHRRRLRRAGPLRRRGDHAGGGQARPGLRGHRLPLLPRPDLAAAGGAGRGLAGPGRGARPGRAVGRPGRAGRLRLRAPAPRRARLPGRGPRDDLAHDHRARRRPVPPRHPVRPDRLRARPVRAARRARPAARPSPRRP